MKIWAGLVLCLCLSLEITSAQDCVDNEAHLVPTSVLTTRNSGRLEVCRGGVWGTVRGNRDSTGFWPTKNIQVACRQLGFIAGLNSVPSIQINTELSSSDPIHYEEVVCDGTEEFLSDCRSFDVTDTAHDTDVYIVCLPGSEPYSGLNSLPVGSVLGGDLRLVGSTANGQGAVEIFTDLLGWTSICPDDEWTDSDAEIICERLGYDSGSSQTVSLQSDRIAARNVMDAQCSDRPSGSGLFRIAARFCSFLDNRGNTCQEPSNTYAGVICRTTEPDQSVRLFNRVSENDRVRGIVEIAFDGRWGLACRPFDESEVAPSVCQGLGYGRSSSVMEIINLQTVESRQKPIWLPQVICTSETESLNECNFGAPIGYGPCANVLAVDCEDPPYSLPGYGTALIVISALAVVGVIVWWFVQGRMVWAKRSSYPKYNKFIACLNGCPTCLRSCGDGCSNCCRNACERRPRAPPSSTPAPAPPASAPAPAPARTTESTFTAPEPQPVEPEVPANSELVNPPPPSYGASASLPQPSADLPPPYTGPSQGYLSAAYPPATANPYPDEKPEKPSDNQAYPPPSGPSAPSAPLPGAYPPPWDPAYPPPGAGYPPPEVTAYGAAYPPPGATADYPPPLPGGATYPPPS